MGSDHLSSAPVPDRADVLIIGAGIVGLSLAWHLRQLGVDRVVLLDGSEPGQQSTGLASGGIRRQFGSRIEIELTLASWRFYEALLSDPTFAGVFQPVGYAFLAGPEQIAPLRRAWTLQCQMGLPVQWLEPADLAERFSYCNLRGVAGGTFCAADGFLDPSDIVQWLLRECRGAGVMIRKHTPVNAIELSGSRVRAVKAGTSRIAADLVVNAAGAWAGSVGMLMGVSIPVEPSPRIKFVTHAPALPPSTPLIVDLPTGAYLRADRGRTTIGVKPEKRIISFHVEAENELLSWMANQACSRFPGLRDATVRGLIRGLYEVTPDGLPLVGRLSGVAGIYVAAGFNGHGIMHGPGAGRALAELIVTNNSKTLDLEPLRPDRFERNCVVERDDLL